MTPHIIFALFAVLLGGAGTAHYYMGIFKGRIKPHVFTWVIWALTTWIIGVAQYVEGGGAGAYVTLLSACVSTTTAVLALKFGDRDITKSDWISFVMALLAIPIWAMTSNPLYAVLLVTCIDLFGFFPTFRKGYHKPWDEGAFLFGAVSIKFLLTYFALENLALVTGLYPMALFIINGIFTIMLMMRRRVVTKA